MSNTNESAVAQEVKEIKVSEVKALLEQGMDRKEIAKHFGKSVAEMSRTVWNHPKLKNLKKKAAPTVVLVDDTAEVTTEEVQDSPVGAQDQSVGEALNSEAQNVDSSANVDGGQWQ